MASVKLGGKWRMPTDAEWTELRTECAWAWTSDYNGTGVKGRIVTATNGNSIFLPPPVTGSTSAVAVRIGIHSTAVSVCLFAPSIINMPIMLAHGSAGASIDPPLVGGKLKKKV